MSKTILSREKVSLPVQNGSNRTPRVGKVVVAAVEVCFSDALVQITLFLSSGSLVKVYFGLPGASWRFLALPGGSWRPLAAPGGPWLAAAGASWRPLAAPGASWRPLALPGVS